MKTRVAPALVVLTMMMLLLAGSASASPPGSDAAATVALQWNAYALAAMQAAKVVDPPATTPRAIYQPR
jgi:hypothetical protein